MLTITNATPLKIYCPDNGIYPNSHLPVLLLKKAITIPHLFAAKKIKALFAKNNWANAWDSGIFTYNHYHSITHEVLAIYKGHTQLLLGGENGYRVRIGTGDVLIIPAGMAHKNLGNEHDIGCIGAYPDGSDYDINSGQPGERPGTDKNISLVPIPGEDPLLGNEYGVSFIWTAAIRTEPAI
jgi:uncharacterized protein YjlB